MRLAGKLTFIMMLGVLSVLSTQALIHIQRILKIYHRDVHEELAMLGGTLSAAVSEIWQSSGRERAEAYIKRVDSRRTQTRIRLIPATDRSLPPALRRTANGAAPLLQQVPDGRIVAFFPLAISGIEDRIFLSLSRALNQEKYTRGVLWVQFITTTTLVMLCTVLAMVLGLRLVGRRVEALIAQARRLAQGQFIPNVDRGRDELGLLAFEMNLMAKQLAEAKQRLRKEYQNTAAILEQLRHADRLSTIGKLTSSIAHELGTPLNVVSGRAMMILDPESETAEINEHAQIIAQQSEHMAQIIRELLDFSRGRSLQKTRTMLAQIIEQAIILMEPLAEKEEVCIDWSEGPPLEATIDGSKVLQILTNLLLNGIQAMAGRGGVLTLKIESRFIKQPAEIHAAEGSYVCISVGDQGNGIAQEDLGQIFKPFFTTKCKGEGTGLGLAVCHGLVKEHGGWIEVQSQPGKGSCFKVFLPR